MVKEGKETLKAFCESSGYTYNDKLVDQILENEQKLQAELNKASKNIFRYKRVCISLLKLSVGWFAASMLYYGIMFSPIPNGVLLNNCIYGYGQDKCYILFNTNIRIACNTFEIRLWLSFDYYKLAYRFLPRHWIKYEKKEQTGAWTNIVQDLYIV